MNHHFTPDWFSPPGITLAALMARRELEIVGLAEALQRDPAYVARLLCGTEKIDRSIAHLLEKEVGGSARFWCDRQQYFDDSLHRVASTLSREEVKEWLRFLPIKEMRDAGWISSSAEYDPVQIAMAYFDVTSPEEWRDHYTSFATEFSYRTSPSFDSKLGALAAWLRQGELQARNMCCARWSAKEFGNAVSDVRSLTRLKEPQAFLGRLRQLCAKAGVAVVFVRAPAGCRASGATRFISPDKAMIILSFRYLSDDHFWFSFFHEAGHLLLHGPHETFIDGTATERTQMEREADAFAESVLIPPAERERMMDLRPKMRDIVRFAVSIGVAPGIVVGQMQHLGILGRSRLNYLKRRYKWEEIQTAVG
jgi:HTH-type transcriptional regulator / antitoxin HigA